MALKTSILRYPGQTRRLKVVSVHGAPGVGKTDFLNEITSHKNRDVMVGSLSAPPSPDQRVCYSCLLRKQMKKLLLDAVEKQAKTLFIEVPCTWSPVEIAEMLEEFGEGETESLAIPDQQAIISVVDARHFWGDLEASETFYDSVSSAETLIEGIEFTDLIVLTHTEEIKEKEVQDIEDYIRKLQTRVEILRRGRDNDLLLSLMGQKRFDYDETFRSSVVDRSPQWSYQRKRPFHPARFKEFLSNMPESVIRATGLVWIATRTNEAFHLSYIAPTFLMMSQDEPWLANSDPFDVAYAFQQDPSFRDIWDPKWGDRRNEISFVGENLSVNELEQSLNHCLLSDIEMRQDWSQFNDPLSEWIEEFEAPDAPDSEEDDPDHSPPLVS